MSLHLRTSPSPRIPLALLLASLLFAAACGGSKARSPAPVQLATHTDSLPGTPPLGSRAFLTADPSLMDMVMPYALAAAAPDMAARESAGAGERQVEEGDIYRLLDAGTLVVANGWRGLQVIDLSDPTQPVIAGRLNSPGSPVEMHVSGDRAILISNAWAPSVPSLFHDEQSPGPLTLVFLVDLSDPAHPDLLARLELPGQAQRSRLATGGGESALYLVSATTRTTIDEQGQFDVESITTLHSFRIEGDDFHAAGTHEIGGYTTDIHADSDYLVVAQHQGWRVDAGSKLSIFDISDPAGTIELRGQVTTAGLVQSQFNLDVQGKVLRAVTSNWARGQENNILQTFDLDSFEELARCDFGAGERLFASLFFEDRAFFVTYFLVDPFHAFTLSPDGGCQERAEFVVSGWNDFFKPVFEGSRLIGVGTDDDDGRSMLAISLYDTTNPDNPHPLIAREPVAAGRSWSEASHDHRASTVLENAVDVAAADGTRETGLILLPFAGISDESGEFVSGVQLFTFSSQTLTRRGFLPHADGVRRAFRSGAGNVGSLAEASLALHNIQDLERPSLAGELELAPNYQAMVQVGGLYARLKSPEFWWWSSQEPKDATIELLDASLDPDGAPVLGSITTRPGASLYAVQGRLVVISLEAGEPEEGDLLPLYDTTIEVWDLQDPATPRRLRSLTTNRLQPGVGGGHFPSPLARIGRPFFGPPSLDVAAFDGGLAILSRNVKERDDGEELHCTFWPSVDEARSCEVFEPGCVSYLGSRNCRQIGDGAQQCMGGFERCVADDDGLSCAAISGDDPGFRVESSCFVHERMRRWEAMTLFVLDFENPEEPVLRPGHTFPEADEAVSLLADGGRIWVAFKRPERVEDDVREYARFFAQSLTLRSGGELVAGPAINVPGTLIAVDGDWLLTRDTVYTEEYWDTAVARSRVQGSEAILSAWHRFPELEVEEVFPDGAGRVLVTRRLPWMQWSAQESEEADRLRLVVLDEPSLQELNSFSLAGNASLRATFNGFAAFDLGNGVVVTQVLPDGRLQIRQEVALSNRPVELELQDARLKLVMGRHGVMTLPY